MAYVLRIKICGVTTAADARQAALLGANAIGLNFYAQSPRCVDRQVVPFILRELPPFVDPVGVFTNLPLPQVYELANHFGGMRTIQWHGDRHELSGTSPFRLIAAFPVRDPSGLTTITQYLELCRGSGQLPAAILVDGHAAGLYGGTGMPAPWKLLADFRPGIPLILAGGLTPENVAEAVKIVRPYAVDVASGVESRPGHKDVEKMRRFIDQALDAAAGC